LEDSLSLDPARFLATVFVKTKCTKVAAATVEMTGLRYIFLCLNGAVFMAAWASTMEQRRFDFF
jgi:hypothetical protein